MRVLVKLFSTVTCATDGSRIPRRVVEEYLSSPGYQESIDKHLMVGTLTHKDRVNKDYKGIIGRDDMLILNNSITHYIEKIFLPEDTADEWVYCIVKILDESLMDKESAENIKKLKGLLRNGIMSTTSAVIVAYWDSNEVAEKLVSIKGTDVTLAPAFKGAGVVKILEDENKEVIE